MRRLQHEGVVEPVPQSTRGPGAYEPVHTSGPPRFDQVLAGLAMRGLVLSYAPEAYGSAVDFNVPGRRLVIPTRVLDQLSPISLPLASAASPERVLLGSADAVLRDLYVVLSAANRAPIPLTSRGLIPKRALVRTGTTSCG